MSNKGTRHPLERSWSDITVGYGIALLGSWLFFLFLQHFWGEYMLIDLKALNGQGDTGAGLTKVWFIFAWALVASLVIGLVLNRWHVSYKSRFVLLIKGLWFSLNAGFFEELIYRAFAFMSAMVILPFVNFITFGFMRWLYSEALVPLANFMTFGALEPQLLGHSNWVFGAAIVSASIKFRNDHKHLGSIGMINAWFLSMVMFYLVFNYGIVTAIVAHVVYDAIVFTVVAASVRRPSNLELAFDTPLKR